MARTVRGTVPHPGPLRRQGGGRDRRRPGHRAEGGRADRRRGRRRRPRGPRRAGARRGAGHRPDAAEASGSGGSATSVTADLETFAGAQQAVEAALAAHGRVDVLVNNVGGTIWARPYEEYDEEKIEKEIRRSLFPTLWSCRAVLPAMLEQGSGTIVNVSSVATRGMHRVPVRRGEGRGERPDPVPGHGGRRPRHPRGRHRPRRHGGPAPQGQARPRGRERHRRGPGTR